VGIRQILRRIVRSPSCGAAFCLFLREFALWTHHYIGRRTVSRVLGSIMTLYYCVTLGCVPAFQFIMVGFFLGECGQSYVLPIPIQFYNLVLIACRGDLLHFSPLFLSFISITLGGPYVSSAPFSSNDFVGFMRMPGPSLPPPRPELRTRRLSSSRCAIREMNHSPSLLPVLAPFFGYFGAL